MTNRHKANLEERALGDYLKDRRARLDPEALGFPMLRRRTPGLRREEVALRAGVSATWYTWLEQGRGGTPSAEVLDGIAGALMLSAAEREHLFLLAQHRLPEAQYQAPEGVTPQLQRVLDSLDSPAYVQNAAWDVVAWNRAAALVLTDYAAFAPEQRNILRLLFCDPCAKERLLDWESHTRFAVATFRSDAARAGASESVTALVDELSRCSSEFAAIWREHDVQAHGEGTKHFCHPTAGTLTLEYSAFALADCPDLGLVIFTPATPEDAERIRALLAEQI